MTTNWREVVDDPKEVMIFEALEDSRYDWRTIRALSRISKLSEDDVRIIIAKYPSLVRRGFGENGKELFTLQSTFFNKVSTWSFTTSGSTTTVKKM